MSIIRVGLAETKDFSDGYDAIFGKKKTEATEPAEETKKKPAKKKATGAKKTTGKAVGVKKKATKKPATKKKTSS